MIVVIFPRSRNGKVTVKVEIVTLLGEKLEGRKEEFLKKTREINTLLETYTLST